MNEYRLDSKGSAWITANAGSGKTYALSRRVVRLLVEGARPESIICLTYTKAAASEMRERVLKLVKKLAITEGDARRDALAEMLGEEPTSEQLQRAAGLLDILLDSPTGGLTITTIHGFCQNLLAGFPLESGILPHSRLMDDAEQSELIQQVIRRLYTSDDTALNESLGFVADIAAELRLGQWLSKLIYQRSEWAYLTQLPTLDAMKTAIQARHPLASYERSYWQEQLDNTPTELLRAMLQAALQGTATQQKTAEVLAQWLDHKNNRDAYIQIWLTKEELSPRKNIAKSYEKTGIAAANVLREQDRVHRIIQAMATIACAEETYHMAVLARAVAQLYSQMKNARFALDYEDLIEHVESLFARELPWVMTKLDYRIDHVLLDEAQDTSPAQWRISEALVNELLLSESPSGQPRSLFVVGDEKQSIYSFQGAAPEMFASTREAWRKNASIDTFALSKSYRSTKPILQLADALSGTNHVLNRDGQAGRVEIWPLVEPTKKEDAIPYHMPQSYDEAERGEAVLALQIAGTIRQWLDEKRELPSRGRAVQAGDIMILVHHRKPMTPLLIRELQQLDIPVAGIDRLALSSHLAVKDCIALMRWLYAPEDDLALAQVLRSPLIGLSEEELFNIAHGRETVSLAQRVSGNEELNAWRQLRHLTPYSFLHQLFEIAGKRRAYATRFGHEIHEVLDELLQHAATHESEMISLLAYAEQLEQGSKEIKREFATAGTHNEVRVMTVHGAKGLEAPIVILADTAVPPDLKKEMWLDGPYVALTDEARAAEFLDDIKNRRRDALQREYERLLYVAVTRAEDECYIAGAKPPRIKEINPRSWYALCHAAISNFDNAVNDAGSLSISAPQKKPVTAPETIIAETINLPAWANSPAKNESRPEFSSPSRLVNTELALYDSTEGDARTRGVIIHKLFELGATADKAGMQNWMRHIAPDWNEKDRNDVAASVHALTTNPDYAWIWTSEGYNELSLMGTITIMGEQKWMNGQIDRLVIVGNQIVILDYKTSSNVPKTLADTSRSYLVQMKAYRELLASKYKDKTIRCALLWTHAPRLDWLDDAIDAISWDELSQAA